MLFNIKTIRVSTSRGECSTATKTYNGQFAVGDHTQRLNILVKHVLPQLYTKCRRRITLSFLLQMPGSEINVAKKPLSWRHWGHWTLARMDRWQNLFSNLASLQSLIILPLLFFSRLSVFLKVFCGGKTALSYWTYGLAWLAV